MNHSRKYPLFVLLILTGCGFLIYFNTLHSEFHFDSTTLVSDKSPVQDLRNFWDIGYWTPHNRPLSNLTFSLNHELDGANPIGYHLVNILIHIINAFLVYLLILRLLSSPALQKYREKIQSGTLFALFVALIFLSHPIQTQSVAYIIQRMTSFSAMLYLLSVLLYYKARILQVHKSSTAKPVLLLTAAVLLGLAAIFAKQNAASFPLAFFIVELFFVRDADNRPARRFTLVFGGMLFAAVAIIISFGLLPSETTDYTRMSYLYTQFRVIVKYIQLLFVPVHLNLDYDFSLSYSFLELKVIGSFLFIALLAGTGIWLFKRRRLISFAIFWFFLGLLIESSLIPIKDVINEHRCYLSVMGFAIVLTSLVFELPPAIKGSVKIILLVILIVAYGFMSYNRNKVWQTGYTLWTDVVKKSPGKARPWNNLGYVTLNYEKELDEAILYFRKAVEIDSGYGKAWNNLGMAYRMKGDLGKAVQNLSKAAAISSEPGIYNNAGCAYLEAGRPDVALFYLLKASEAVGDDANLLYNIGLAHFAMGDTTPALDAFLRTKQLDPRNNNATRKISYIYSLQHKYDLAITYILQSLQMYPGDAEMWELLGNNYYYQGRYEKASGAYTKALSIDPDKLEVKNNLEEIQRLKQR
jgi:tetratricopeptide (TPR) repeat protein